VLHIPFENLNIHYNIPITLDLAAIYKKVISENRGGFCYELNYLFCEFLKELGFPAQIIAARIFTETGELGPAFDHMSILVSLEGVWLVDVGYGDLFIEPIRVDSQSVTKDQSKWFKTEQINEFDYLLWESTDGIQFTKRYQFDIRPQQIGAFEAQCHFKQYSADSHFVKKLICTLATKDGRITILNQQFIERKNKERIKTTINSKEELEKLLEERFNLFIKKD
jgi:N-hydroxyarylamine O-acetyltransferase